MQWSWICKFEHACMRSQKYNEMQKNKQQVTKVKFLKKQNIKHLKVIITYAVLSFLFFLKNSCNLISQWSTVDDFREWNRCPRPWSFQKFVISRSDLVTVCVCAAAEKVGGYWGPFIWVTRKLFNSHITKIRLYCTTVLSKHVYLYWIEYEYLLSFICNWCFKLVSRSCTTDSKNGVSNTTSQL